LSVRGQLSSLTARQREIVALAATGATSREIATRLSVSARTVENHLQNAYTKLGITSRDELVRVANESSHTA
jgi:DNA-binding CsgD family transcriptional regulator